MVNLFFKLAVLLVTFSFLECSTQKSDTQLNQAFGQDSASTKIKINSLEDTSELSLKADLLYANDQYDEALELYTKLLTIDSLNGKFNYRKGFCLLSLTRREESIKYYLRSIDLNFKKFESYKSLGIIYYMGLNDYPRAKKYFEKCLEINPHAEDVKKYLIEIEKSKTLNL